MSYNPYVQQGYYQQPQQPQPQQQSRPNIALKKSFGSGLYLMVAIFNTLIFALAVVNIFMPLASIEMILQQFAPQLSELGISQSEINEALRMMSSFNWVLQLSNITACIFPFLTVLAMWLIWGNSRKQNLPVGTAGFTILKIIAILDLIGVCLIGILTLIMMVPAIVGGSALDQALDLGVSATLLIIILFVILIAAIVLIIIYYAKLLAIYTAAKDIGRLGVTTAKVSMFVIVINFIGLIFQLVGVAGNVITLNFMGAGSSLLALLSTLFMTIVFVKFRNAIEEQKAATPPAPAPMNNPYQPYQSPQQPYGYQQQNQYAHPYPAPQQPYGYPQQGQYQQRTYQQQQAFQQYNNYNAQMQAQQQLQQQGQQTYQQTFQPQQNYQQQAFQAQQAVQQQAQTFQPQAESFQAQTFQPAAAEVEQAAEEATQAAQTFASETVTPSDVIDE